jgi:membrane protease YdiL (CAAX protease family)
VPVLVPPAERPAKGPGISGGGIAGVGAGLGVLAGTAIQVALLVAGHYRSLSNDPWLLIGLELPLWAGFGGAAYLASRRNGSGSLRRDYGLWLPSRSDTGLGLLGSLVARSLSFLLLLLAWLASRGSHGHAGGSILGVPLTSASSWVVVVLLTVVGAPIFEELFFRGLIQGAFSRRIGPVAALFVTAVIFSVSHVPSEGILAPSLLFPAAVVLGYLKMKTNRLGAGMVAHAAFNGIGLLLMLTPIAR